jgi:hypothetical protein
MHLLIPFVLFVVFAAIAGKLERGRKRRAHIRGLRGSVPAQRPRTDYSGYSAERLLANRSERWD